MVTDLIAAVPREGPRASRTPRTLRWPACLCRASLIDANVVYSRTLLDWDSMLSLRSNMFEVFWTE